MEIECKIEGFKDCKTKTNVPFWKIETNKGSFNCWKADVKDLVEEYLDGMCTLVLEEKNGFKNVIGIKDAVDTQLVHNPVTNDKMTTMYTSYAKDVFIALTALPTPTGLMFDEMMEKSIALVKQAKEAFS